MRNEYKSRIEKIITLAEKLPYFSFNDLLPIEKNKTYLKILFSRYTKRKKLIRLKKGLYVTKKYIDEKQKTNSFSSYLEFISNILSKPSYLSLDYILYSYNLLTELPVNFTLVSIKKPTVFSNELGIFYYHKIKEELFCGFKIFKEGKFTILKATKTKALFDFLYFRKNLLINSESVKELRLNINNLNKNDLKEFKKYLEMEGSKKMKQIYIWLFK
jgi:predicted transcriptional regulator of viral defense system